MSSDRPSVLITGAYRGIGLEVAGQLAVRGCKVWLTARKTERGQQAAASLKGDVHFLPLDVTDSGSIAQAASQVPRLDILINNAAVLLDGETGVLDLPEETLASTLNANAVGPLRVAQAFAPVLRKSQSPRIVNVSSGAGQLSDPATWAPAYCISKTALNAVTVQLAAAWPDFAINAVCPGWVRTDMGGNAAPRSVEQGADTIVWLSLDAPQSLTGKFLRDREVIPW